MMKIAFSPPDITEQEINEVTDTLRSGWITTGPKTKRFEEEIAGFCHTRKAVCLNSSTAALELSLRILGVGPGDEVITTAYTLDLAGIIYPYYDKMFNIAAEKKFLFHPAGKLQKALGRIAVIADGAHAFGAMKEGKMCGEIADFTSFSFHAVKNLTTAEGGAVVWKEVPEVSSEDIYNRYMELSLHGQSKDAFAKLKPGNWEYDIVAPFYKYNMTDIMAALGLAQFSRYPGLLKRRREIIEKYNEGFKDLNISVLDHYGPDHSSSGHLYLTRIPGRTREECNEVIDKMAEAGIATNVHYKPLPMMTAYKNLGFHIENYQNAYHMFENEITLPLHTCLTDEEIEYVIHTYRKIVKEL